jgi:undecaprenyl phosphate-alpha-L-ara4FN deformylase
MKRDTIVRKINLGRTTLEKICGKPIDCAAVPGWRLTEDALLARESFSFRYLSDCRGATVFYPFAGGRRLRTPQVPVTLPTYDELIGTSGVTNETYNNRLLELFKPEKLNVLTIHAEVEGIACRSMFAEFLDRAVTRRISFFPLGDLLEKAPVSQGTITSCHVPGREGWVACQNGGNL